MSLSEVQSIINSAQASAASALNDARSYASNAQSAASTIVSPGSSGTIVWSKPSLLQPINATSDLGAAFLQQASNEFASLGPDFMAKFNSYIATYFPNVNACLQANSDNWICNMIVNGGNGIPDAVSSMIWQRAREAILNEVAAARDGAYTDFAARGFTLPGGALNARLLQIDQTRIDKSAEVARDTAIKNIEIQIENIRFAVDKAIAVRLGAAQAALGYCKEYLQTYEDATERAKAMTTARVQLWNSVNDYYRAFAAIEALDIKVKEANIDHTLADNQLFVKAAAEGTDIKVKAALAAAQSLGSAAAALGSQNTLAYTGDNTTS